MVTILFIICVSVTITSFREIPLWKLEAQPTKPPDFLNDDEDNEESPMDPAQSDQQDTPKTSTSYGSLNQDQLQIPTSFVNKKKTILNKL